MKRLPSGARLENFDTLDSTNAEAKRRAGAGDAGPCWILARRQTAGYGRRGRAWETGAENFAGTCLFTPDGAPAHFGQLSYVIALGVIEALDPYAIVGALALKWPNDVLAGVGKLAGILIESVQCNGRTALCIGVGVNLTSSPADTPYPTARLADHLRDGASAPSPEALAAAIDEKFAALYALWRRDGFAPIRDAWLARAHGVGETVQVRLPNEEFSGVFRDLDADGNLVVSIGDSARRVAAGEIMFGE